MVTAVEEEQSEDIKQVQYVIFQLGPEEYGIEINMVKEIIKPTRITNVPNTDEHVLGVINLRGQIVPVVDLRNRFDFDNEKISENQRIITVEVSNTLIGLMVDDVNEVLWLNEEEIEPPPEVAGGIKQEYLKGVGKVDERLLVLINLEQLLFSEIEENTNVK
ncbi:MAG: chemotaxis protein CheW [Bacillota bacterium]